MELAAGRGELVVFSNPRGAWAEVDGERHRGRTPLVLNLAVSDARSGKRGVASSASQDRGIRLLREL